MHYSLQKAMRLVEVGIHKQSVKMVRENMNL